MRSPREFGESYMLNFKSQGRGVTVETIIQNVQKLKNFSRGKFRKHFSVKMESLFEILISVKYALALKSMTYFKSPSILRS